MAADAERKREITQLGLTYHLLRSETSFVAVDHVARNSDPNSTPSIAQPLPLPAGVSDLAVGGTVPTSPEPEIGLLFGVASALLGWAKRRKARHG